MVRWSVVPKPPVVRLGVGVREIRAVVDGIVGQHVFQPAVTSFDAVRSTVRHDDIPPTA
jgi:hypothetical protein